MPSAGRQLIADPFARFHSYYTVAENGCWEWEGHLNEGGYGMFTFDGHRMMAHRAAHLMFVGPIPDGLDIDHVCHGSDETCKGGKTCRHRSCVNPQHLEPVTHSENLSRGEVGLWHREIERCPLGHPYDAVNTYHDPRGWRGCHICRRTASQNYDRRNRAA